MKYPVVININNLIGGLVIVSTENPDSVKEQVKEAVDKALNRVKELSCRAENMDIPESAQDETSEPESTD